MRWKWRIAPRVPRLLPASGLRLCRNRLAIHGQPVDQKRRKDRVSIVIRENENPPSRGWHGDMINRGHAQLPAIGQMNRERHERLGCNQLSHVVGHPANHINPALDSEQPRFPPHARRHRVQKQKSLDPGAFKCKSGDAEGTKGMRNQRTNRVFHWRHIER